MAQIPGCSAAGSAPSRSSSPKSNGGASSASAARKRSSRCSSSAPAASPWSTAAARCEPGDGASNGRAGRAPAGSNMGKGQVKAADYFLSRTSSPRTRTRRRRHRRAAGGAIGGMFGGWRPRDVRLARRRHQRQEGRGERHSVAGQRPHDRGRSADRRLFPQAGPKLRGRRQRRLVGRLRRRGRRRLPEYGDRPDHRPRLPRRLHQAGHPARRRPGHAADRTGSGARAALSGTTLAFERAGQTNERAPASRGPLFLLRPQTTLSSVGWTCQSLPGLRLKLTLSFRRTERVG